ncbi:MAG: hypothetical protein IPL26_12980 [Leptospiraceae bacterium]|nr:hypothetical protein [Leptospiraceae bacterium]
MTEEEKRERNKIACRKYKSSEKYKEYLKRKKTRNEKKCESKEKKCEF